MFQSSQIKNWNVTKILLQLTSEQHWSELHGPLTRGFSNSKYDRTTGTQLVGSTNAGPQTQRNCHTRADWEVTLGFQRAGWVPPASTVQELTVSNRHIVIAKENSETDRCHRFQRGERSRWNPWD